MFPFIIFFKQIRFGLFITFYERRFSKNDFGTMASHQIVNQNTGRFLKIAVKDSATGGTYSYMPQFHSVLFINSYKPGSGS